VTTGAGARGVRKVPKRCHILFEWPQMAFVGSKANGMQSHVQNCVHVFCSDICVCACLCARARVKIYLRASVEKHSQQWNSGVAKGKNIHYNLNAVCKSHRLIQIFHLSKIWIVSQNYQYYFRFHLQLKTIIFDYYTYYFYVSYYVKSIYVRVCIRT